MISLLTTSPFTGEISDLVGVVQVQQERDIWVNKRDVWQADAKAHLLKPICYIEHPTRPLQLAPIGQTLRSADDHIPLLEPGFLWCLDITFRENLQYFDFLFSALKSTNLCKVKTFDMLPLRTAPNCWSSNSSWVPYHLIFIIYSL